MAHVEERGDAGFSRQGACHGITLEK